MFKFTWYHLYKTCGNDLENVQKSELKYIPNRTFTNITIFLQYPSTQVFVSSRIVYTIISVTMTMQVIQMQTLFTIIMNIMMILMMMMMMIMMTMMTLQ